MLNSLTAYFTRLKVGKLMIIMLKSTGITLEVFGLTLLFALPLLDGDSTIKVTGKIESEDYIKMTIQTIESMGIKIENIESGYYVKGNQKYRPTESMTVEKDWSNAAFFVCMGAMSERGITLQDMNTESTQGDKEILEVVKKFDARIEKSSESIV